MTNPAKPMYSVGNGFGYTILSTFGWIMVDAAKLIDI
jgi:hypothetical protein